MAQRRKKATFEIALAGISAALALICLVLYYYVPVAKLSFLALASLALTLPLAVRSVRGSALAYLAAGGLAIAATTPLAVVPYAFLFGWQPVVMGFCKRYLPRRPYISLPLKAALFNAGLYGVYALYGLGDTVQRVLQRLSWQPAYWAIALVGTVLWLGYDYLIDYLQRWIERRAAKVIAKYLPDEGQDHDDGTPNARIDSATVSTDGQGDAAGPTPNDAAPDKEDPFGPDGGKNEGGVPPKEDTDGRG